MSGLIQGADKWICLSPISKLFLSVRCTIEAWEKSKESLKSPSRNQRNSGARVFRGSPALGRRAEVSGQSCPTAQLQQPAPGLPRDSQPQGPAPAGDAGLLPTEGRGCRRHYGSRALRSGLWLLRMGSRRHCGPLRQAPTLALQVTCFQFLVLDTVNTKSPGVCWSRKVKSALSAGAVQAFHPLSI